MSPDPQNWSTPGHTAGRPTRMPQTAIVLIRMTGWRHARAIAEAVSGGSARARRSSAGFLARRVGWSYPILSDPTREVARAYGVLTLGRFASRWTFYIGGDGRILDIDRK